MKNIQVEPESIELKDRSIAAQPKDHIPGWGFDADPDNDPTYPMKHRTGADYERLNYEKPPQQKVDMEILHSIERPGITRVFGTSTPPSGLSGLIRKQAYKFSEAETAHWMMLILADRVNAIEGIFEDFANGIIPNIIKERGWTAEWKYNKIGIAKKAAVGILVLAAAVVILKPSVLKGSRNNS